MSSDLYFISYHKSMSQFMSLNMEASCLGNRKISLLDKLFKMEVSVLEVDFLNFIITSSWLIFFPIFFAYSRHLTKSSAKRA